MTAPRGRRRLVHCRRARSSPQRIESYGGNRSHFLLLINGDEEAANAEPPEAFAAMMQAVEAFDRQITDEGRKVASLRLQQPTSAKTIRLVDGEKIVTDGPYVDTKEHLGGLWIIEAADMGEAMAIADRLPCVPFASVEVRPVLSIEIKRIARAL